MTLAFAPDDSAAIRLIAVAPDNLDPVLDGLPGPQAGWARANGFRARGGEVAVLPDGTGAIAVALVGTGSAAEQARERFLIAQAARRLPAGTYRLEGLSGASLEEAALGWLLESYRFARYRSSDAAQAMLCAPEGIDHARTERIANAEALTRDLINTPAADMGPADLEGAARALADRHGASLQVVTGDDLLPGFPLIHAVGRAASPARAPRLIDLRWGHSGPSLTLVGKGVCFDTGGLDLKPAASMGLMKRTWAAPRPCLALRRW